MSGFLGVHLVGSMQAATTDEVFQAVGANLKDWSIESVTATSA